jgi:hypothetical protein
VESAEDFVFELKNNMEEFLDDFWKEYKNQSKRKNKSSEKRMRILLSSFKNRVQKPYKNSSLNKENVGIKTIFGEENASSIKNTS